MDNQVFGVDVGGTGIKAAVVDTVEGKLISEKIKYATPEPKDPPAILATIKRLVEAHDWPGPIACGFPAIIHDGVCKSAANIHKDWIGYPVENYLSEHLGTSVKVVNDADAAGLAEMKFGEGKGKSGTVITLTLGTGIGSGMFSDGHLVRNTELGHLLMWGESAELKVSNRARERESLTWHEWGNRLSDYLNHVSFLFTPSLIILGGGVSKHFSEYESYLDVDCEIVPAAMKNNAGIVGAALALRA